MYFLSHSPIDFYFRQHPNDFVVTEIPLYEYSGVGEHIILRVRKKNLTTWEMVEAFAKFLNISTREIGYAGLKDKNALTIQDISINKKYEAKLSKFNHQLIKILNTTRHTNKIKRGHLKANRFFVRLKKVNPVDATKLQEALKSVANFGLPNYFGYQRFGNDKNNYELGDKLLNGEIKIKDRTKREFMINAFQSHLFNKWLAKRVEISKIIESFSLKELKSVLDIADLKELKAQEHPFKILRGDIASHYPLGKIFKVEEYSEAQRFLERSITVTGLLSGKRVMSATDLAQKYEEPFIDSRVTIDGSRRFAWVYAEDIESEYKKSEFHFELSFTLPKGSYATTLLEELAHRELN
jgi:tRNA pseudouridine13 synthase